MELGPQNQKRDGFLGPNSINSVYGPSGNIEQVSFKGILKGVYEGSIVGFYINNN